jgi:pyruvate dehydrogenase E1 component alpha subunit
MEKEKLLLEPDYNFFSYDLQKVVDSQAADYLKEDLKKMLLIRHFELRAESAYQMGKIGGFFHSYIGQEAIQTACIRALGVDHWYCASYRCHALALLLGATPNELMAELYGKVTGNVFGRGGSMHFFTSRLLGGHGIVGGQIPIGAGAAFAAKYLGNKSEFSVTFMGDGAVAQGSFHETLNLASLWNLPAIFVIENNQWGMGTHVARAIAIDKNIADLKAQGYDMISYLLDGMDYFNCLAGFSEIKNYVSKTGKPLLVEVITERFKGHSISDPALYRSKEELALCLSKDPLEKMKKVLMKFNIISDEEIEKMDFECKEIVIQAMKFAEDSLWPDPLTLEEEVYAP